MHSWFNSIPRDDALTVAIGLDTTKREPVIRLKSVVGAEFFAVILDPVENSNFIAWARRQGWNPLLNEFDGIG